VYIICVLVEGKLDKAAQNLQAVTDVLRAFLVASSEACNKLQVRVKRTKNKLSN